MHPFKKQKQKQKLHYKPGVGWLMPIVPCHQKLRQEDCRFEARLGNLGRPCLKNKKNQCSSVVKYSRFNPTTNK